MQRLPIVALILLVGVTGCGHRSGDPQEAAAVSAIERLAGTVEYDKTSPDKFVQKVYLNGTAVKDADLVVLEKLPKVQNLFLGNTKITDSGLEHLKGKTSLVTLSLNSTAVSDAGIKHLAGLSSLKTLNLQDTRVTMMGASELRRALPTTTIAR